MVTDTLDIIIELPGGGDDIVLSSSYNYTLSNNVENIHLTGIENINGSGNALDNYIIGNQGNNILIGGAGNDILRGIGGTDTLIGGLGDDSYNDNYYEFSNIANIIENTNEGIDSISTCISYTLSINIENLSLGGDADINGTGNELDNTLTGNTGGANILTGGSGNDRFWGYYWAHNQGSGDGVVDIFLGGQGNDSYWIDWSNNDITIENTDEGIDTVLTNTITYTLGANVENLILLGIYNGNSFTAYNGTGNELDNMLIGNYVANILVGATGHDTLTGGEGNDVYVYNRGDGQDSIDDLDWVGGSDSLLFGAGITDTDVLAFKSGNDLFFKVQDSNDQIGFINYYAANTTVDGEVFDHKINSVEFANGVIWDQNMIQSVIDLAGNNHAPTINSYLPTLQAHTGNLFTYTVPGDTIIDPDDGDFVTYSVKMPDGSAIPPWLNFDAASRTLSGIPAAGDVGSLQFMLWGTDKYNCSTGENVTLNVGVPNNAPILATALPDQSAALGGPFTYSISTSAFADPDAGDILSYSATLSDGSALPSWLSFNASTRTFSGTPSVLGTVSVRVTATDTGSLSVSDIFDLSVTVQNLTLNGTAGADTLNGGAGNDSLNGLGANDTLYGNAGNDILSGGTGNDTMRGGIGNDIYIVDSTSDIVSENLSEGIDLMQSSVTCTLAANVENLTLTGTSAINGTGNTLDNVLLGNSAVNTLTGGAGNDTLNGGAGNDKMLGGLGNDTYLVDISTDVVTESANQGTDTVQSSVTYTLAANVENLTLTGTSAINGTGNTLSNILIGNSAANTLSGGTGADSMFGGLGNDIYIIENVGDIVTEYLGEGTDTVKSGVSYTLSDYVEQLTLTGSSAINGTGNAFDNILTGNSGVNILTGGAGNDTLSGGAGADKMFGGFGNDTYVVDVATDVITENAGEGIDSVQSKVTYTLAANVENLALTGTSAIKGTGNTLDNVLLGNSAANTLNGGTGNDILSGALGNDTLTGGAGNDIFVFDTVLNATNNKDSLSDYTAGQDKIQVDKDIFASLADTGTLSAAFFRSSSNGLAADNNDYFLYNTSTGALCYDLDGNGAGVAVQFATLTTKPSITAGDFLVVA